MSSRERESSLRERKARAARVAACSAGADADELGISDWGGLSWALGGLSHAPDAHLTPAGDGHVLDEGLLERGARLEFLDESGEESAEAILGLASENDGGGEQSMSDGVAGGGESALGSGRAMGFA